MVTTRSRNSPSSSSDTDTGKTSPTCSHIEDNHNHVLAASSSIMNQPHIDIETTQNTIANATVAHINNSLSKTSVFERLYKSNIAALKQSSLIKNQQHQGLDSVTNNNVESQLTHENIPQNSASASLRKNMSNSTASLASTASGVATNTSSTCSSSLLSHRKANWTPRGRSNLARSKAVVNNVSTLVKNCEDGDSNDCHEDQCISSSN